MGDPRRQKKKYSRPSQPWTSARIEEEKALRREYGLKNMREIWKARATLKKFSSQAKRLTRERTAQADVERKHLMDGLRNLGLLNETSQLSDVLTLTVGDFLGRRLQTVVHKKGLARSMKQARQFITHRHITLGGNVLTIPSYLVKKEEEASLGFIGGSAFVDEMHPERVQPKKEEPAPVVSPAQEAPAKEEKKEEKAPEEKKEAQKSE